MKVDTSNEMKLLNALPMSELSGDKDAAFTEGYISVRKFLSQKHVQEAIAPVLKKHREEIKESGTLEDNKFITPVKEAMTGSDLSANLAIMQFYLDKAFPYSFDDPQRNIMQVSKEKTVPNFKSVRIYRAYETEDLEEVQPGGVYHGTYFGDTYADVAIKKYGRRFPITMEAMKNDVLGEFTDLQDKLVRSAKRTMFKLLTNLFAANGTFYASGNANLASGALATETLKSAITLMEKQVDDNSNPINVVAKYLMVPVALKWMALALTNPTLRAQLAITSADNLVPTFELTPIINPFLDAVSTTGWYLFADPNELEAIMHLALDGHPGIELLMKISDQQMISGGMSSDLGSYLNDSLDIKVRLFFNKVTRFHQASTYSPGT
jgi:hypothetical protein